MTHSCPLDSPVNAGQTPIQTAARPRLPPIRPDPIRQLPIRAPRPQQQGTPR